MNILIGFYNDNAKTGGAEGILRQIAEYHLACGDEVYLLFQMQKQYGHWEEINHNKLHLHYGGSILRRLRTIWRLRKTAIDYSYSSIVRVTGPLGLMKRLGLLHIKTMVGRESTSIFTRYKGLRLLYYQMWYRLGYKAIDTLICQTSYMKQQLLVHLPWLEKYTNVVVIPNPVNLSLMEEKGKEVLDVDSLKPYIVTAGRFIPEKAYDILVDAFSKVVKENPQMRLVILGDGLLRSQMVSQTERLGLSDCVVFQGQVDNVYPWFRESALCVVSSRLEGFPNVLLQMMSQNERVVSTLCAGDIDKINGLTTCPPNDAEALARAIETSLKENDLDKNRVLFDEELRSRSIDVFINRVETN